MAKVADLGCIACEYKGYPGTPAQVHHVKLEVGWGRSSHFATIPLCFYHHVGQGGIHTIGRRQFAHEHGYTEIEFLEIVYEKLGLEFKECDV